MFIRVNLKIQLVNLSVLWFKHILFPKKVELGLNEQSAIDVLKNVEFLSTVAALTYNGVRHLSLVVELLLVLVSSRHCLAPWLATQWVCGSHILKQNDRCL
jgi:hypothetical protein